MKALLGEGFFIFAPMNNAEAYEKLKTYMTEARDLLFQEVVAQRTRRLCVVVEDVYQPHNASAVLRSCDCFGIQDVHIIENENRWQLSEGVSMGADKWLTVNRYDENANNTKACLKQLKQSGYRIVATTPHRDDYVLKTLPLNHKLAIVFGTEVSGVSDEVKTEADYFLRIPMYGFTESFNISVAAALTLYELTDRLRQECPQWQLTQREQDDLLLHWATMSVREGEKILRSIRSEDGSPT